MKYRLGMLVTAFGLTFGGAAWANCADGSASQTITDTGLAYDNAANGVTGGCDLTVNLNADVTDSNTIITIDETAASSVVINGNGRSIQTTGAATNVVNMDVTAGHIGNVTNHANLRSNATTIITGAGNNTVSNFGSLQNSVAAGEAANLGDGDDEFIMNAGSSFGADNFVDGGTEGSTDVFTFQSNAATAVQTFNFSQTATPTNQRVRGFETINVEDPGTTWTMLGTVTTDTFNINDDASVVFQSGMNIVGTETDHLNVNDGTATVQLADANNAAGGAITYALDVGGNVDVDPTGQIVADVSQLTDIAHGNDYNIISTGGTSDYETPTENSVAFTGVFSDANGDLQLKLNAAFDQVNSTDPNADAMAEALQAIAVLTGANTPLDFISNLGALTTMDAYNDALAALSPPDSGASDAYMAAITESLVAATSYMRARCSPNYAFDGEEECNKQLRVWFQAQTAAGRNDAAAHSGGTYSAYDQRRVTGMAGVEGDILPGITAGILGALASGEWSQDDPAVTGDVMTTAVMAYLRGDLGMFVLDAGVGFQGSETDQKRRVAFNNYSEIASAQYKSREFIGSLRAELPVQITERATLRPWSGLTWSRRHQEGYTESMSNGDAALMVGDLTKSVTTAKVGALVEFSPSALDLNKLRLLLGYHGAFIMGDDDDTRTVEFVNDPNNGSWVHSARATTGIQHNLTAGVKARLNDMFSVTVSYAGTFSSDFDGLDNRLSARVGMAF